MIRNYIIDDIVDFGLIYQIWAKVHDSEDTENSFYVHFLNVEEQPINLKVGSKIKGELYIDVKNSSVSKEYNSNLMHTQSWPKKIGHDSDIVAVVDVIQVIDEFSALVKTDFYKSGIIVEFNTKMMLHENDRIHIEGLLELDYEA